LTGRKPFQAENAMEMFLQHVNGKFERPSRVSLDIPVWLDTLVCQLMEKDPARRPRDAAAVAEALGRVVEKVTAQQSAGVDAVRARAVDRLSDAAAPDETDKRAARTLLGTMRKKRRKGRTVPFLQRTWVRAAGLSALLVVLVGAIVWAFLPPGADKVYEQARQLMDPDNPDNYPQARGPIDAFLARFPGDARSGQVRDWSERIALHDQYQDLKNRAQRARKIGTDFTPGNDAEGLAYQAWRYEDFGDNALAAFYWQQLSQKYAKDDDKRSWARLAERREQELKKELPAEDGVKQARRALVGKKLTEAAELADKPAGQRQARLVFQDIVALYDKDADPKVAEAVEAARRYLTPPEKPPPKGQP
jgi:hypothetical protein